MGKMKSGFTLIEVGFFIVITGALFVGIIIGTQNSIWQQKYNDSVQSYTDFLRNVYSGVSNTQGQVDSGGRSDKAIYGKLISFGQKYDLNGEKLPEDGTQKIFVYDVIGDANGEGASTLSESFVKLGANVFKEGKNGEAVIAGMAESYTPIWGAAIENVDGNDYEGTILVVRHPGSGMINTLVYSGKNGIININEKIKGNVQYVDVSKILTELLGDNATETSFFQLEQVDFCLNPYGQGVSSMLRRDIRILQNARNASSVEIIDENKSECKKS